MPSVLWYIKLWNHFSWILCSWPSGLESTNAWDLLYKTWTCLFNVLGKFYVWLFLHLHHKIFMTSFLKGDKASTKQLKILPFFLRQKYLQELYSTSPGEDGLKTVLPKQSQAWGSGLSWHMEHRGQGLACFTYLRWRQEFFSNGLGANEVYVSRPTQVSQKYLDLDEKEEFQYSGGWETELA